MEKIPDITSDTLDKLRKLNINSVYQLAVQSPSELALEINDVYFDVESAARLIGNTRKILIENKILSKEFSTGDDLLEKRNKISRYSTGSSHFDAFLNGGFETQSITEKAGFELIYADTDAVFLKRKDATKNDFEKIMNELISETRMQMTLEFHYKFLVLLYIESDEKMEAKKHYFGFTYGKQLITRGIDTRRHDSPAFIKEFQQTLLSKLFDCQSSEEVLTTGYQNALEYITQKIVKLMNGEVQITDARFVSIGIIGVITVFAILVLFVGGGGVRHVPITFNEIIQATVAFRDINGETKVVGITGNT